MRQGHFHDLIGELIEENRLDEALTALDYFTQRPSSIPLDKMLHYFNLTAILYFQQGNDRGAIDSVMKGLALNELDGELNYTAGLILTRKGQFPDALFHLRMAWTSCKNNVKYVQALSAALSQSGHPDPSSVLDPCDERMYFHPDKEMGIVFNAHDADNVRRHKERYNFAASLIKGAGRVLDGACGTGYGSEILSGHVQNVIAIDLDDQTVRYAAKHHCKPNIRYLRQNLNELDLGGLAFDAIVSLETLEHVSDPRPYLNGLTGLLEDHGVFVVSTPISKNGGPSNFNKHHLFEYNILQFKTLLSHYFNRTDIYLQHVNSVIEPVKASLPDVGFLLAVCRQPTRRRLPIDGDFKRFLVPDAMPRFDQPRVRTLGMIMAKGKDPRDYGTPLGLGYIASYLRQKNPALKVIIARNEQELLDARPDIIGISAVSSTYGHAVSMARQFKLSLGSMPIIIGGPHISRLPGSLDPVFSAGVIGEGEQTMLEVISAINDGTPLTDVPGLVIHGGNTPVPTGRRDIIKPLDLLPLPWRSPTPLTPHEATLFTSRGCPYRCAFCSSSREKFRAFSAEYVVSEIEHILETMPGVNSLYFLDDLFIADRKRLRKIVELLEKRQLAGRFAARGFVRANLLNDETAELLKRMNFAKVRFGAESGSDRILRFLKSGSVSVEENQRCIDICNRHQLPVSGSFVFGSPGETREDLQATFDFIARNRGRMEVEGFYLMMPLPGTQMWDIAKHRGAVSDSMDWSRLNLDMTNPDFNWDTFIYFNESMPKSEFVSMIRDWLGLAPATCNQPEDVKSDLKIEVGCGEAPKPGYLHVDIRPLPGVDIVAPAWDLPLDTGSVSAIYSRHVLEHFVKSDGEKALREWFRVLASKGELHLIVPNIAFHLRQWFEGDQDWAMAGFWGWQKHEHDVHKWGYTWETLNSTLCKAGFSGIQNLTGQPHSQEKDEKHLEVRAYKP